MKRFSYFIVPLVTLLFLFTGCQNSKNPVEIEMLSQSEISTLAKKGPVLQSVTGSGQLNRPIGVVQWRTFSMNARMYSDGTVGGMFQVNNHGPGPYAKGSITCFSIDGNQAWLGGIVEKSDIPGLIGSVRGWRVVDNGEGANSSPDQISLIGVANNNNASDYCSDQPDRPALHDIEAGNIQVRP